MRIENEMLSRFNKTSDVKMDDIPLAYRRDTAPRHLARLIHFITDSDFLTAKPLSSFRIVFTRSEQRKRC